MSPILTIVLIIVVLVVVAAVVYGVQAGRRRRLRNTFGPEYDRAVTDTGSRAEAEKELRERERRHAELELRPLSPESQAKYSADWEEVQIQFVDNPAEAVGTADELVTRLIAERGYPTRGYEDQLADLSVEHADTLQHYRDAHEISERNTAGRAGTEDLRQALVHYRALFAELLGTEPVPADGNAGATDGTATTVAVSEPGATAESADTVPVGGAGTAADRPVAATTTEEKQSTTGDEQSAPSTADAERPAPAPRPAAGGHPTTASDTSR